MKYIRFCAISGLILIALILSASIARREGARLDRGIFVHVVDLGQGDCLVIETADGNVMIDAGVDSSEKDLRAYLRSRGLTHFDYLILSHPHDDHVGNADMVVREFTVDHVIGADTASQEPAWANVVAAVGEVGIDKGTDWISPSAGSVYYIGKLRLEVLSVPAAENVGENGDSLILRVDYGNCSMLLTGDIESREEEKLIAEFPKEKLRADFLKVAHHGSSGSSSEAFLQAVSPRIATISCGVGNSFSHPHEETLSRLRQCYAEIYRTDIHGTLRFYCDGNTFSLESILP